jgi:hypothetical protein
MGLEWKAIYSTTLLFLFEAVRYCLFGFSLLKLKLNRTKLFFNFSICFFFTVRFFRLSRLIGFLVFLLTPNVKYGAEGLLIGETGNVETEPFN